MNPELSVTVNPDLDVVKNSVEILKGAAGVLQENLLISDKAVVIGKNILDAIEATEKKMMDKELYERGQAYIVKCKERKEHLNANRKPITAITDLITKLFTSAENKIDVNKPDSMAYKIQAKQNEYVKELARLEAENERKRLAEAAKVKERGMVEARYIETLRNFVTDAQILRKRKMTTYFDQLTLENWDAGENVIRNAAVAWKEDGLKDYSPVIPVIYLTQEEKDEIRRQVIENELGELIANYNATVAEHQRYLSDRLVSKKIQLEDLAKADEEETERIRLAQEEEARDNERKLQLEQTAAQEANKNVAAVKEKEAHTNALFSAASVTSEAPKTKKQLVATPQHPGAYALMFELWFREEGKDLALTDFPKKTLAQINAYATKASNRKDNPIKIESPYIKYEEEIKVVNRKS